jgi:hypothetical protein
MTGDWEDANKKAGAERRRHESNKRPTQEVRRTDSNKKPALERRRKWDQRIFLAANRRETIA